MISATKNELSLFVFIDALGWEIFSEHGLCEKDWQTAGPLESVLGYSCTCDPTILTGEMPDRHRHFSFFFKQADASPFAGSPVSNGCPIVSSTGTSSPPPQQADRQLHGYDGYFQLYETPFEVLPYFDYMEKRDIYQPAAFLAVNQRSLTSCEIDHSPSAFRIGGRASPPTSLGWNAISGRSVPDSLTSIWQVSTASFTPKAPRRHASKNTFAGTSSNWAAS